LRECLDTAARLRYRCPSHDDTSSGEEHGPAVWGAEMTEHSFAFSPRALDYLTAVPANAAADNLAALIETVRPDAFVILDLLDEERPRPALAACFEWDDRIVARKWREHQLDTLIQALRSPDGLQTYTRLRDPYRVAGYYADIRHNPAPT
jgi:hypothetical protein